MKESELQNKSPIFSGTIIKKYAVNPALMIEQSVWNYQQLAGMVEKTTRTLNKAGFNKNEKVAILSSNSLEYVILLLTLWREGIIAVPLNLHWPIQLIEKSLNNLHCFKVAVSKNFLHLFSKEKFEQYSLEDLVALYNSRQSNQVDDEFSFDLRQKATIIYTSGSSAEPKAVLHTLGNHYYSALGSNQNIPFSSGDRWLLSLPLYHVGGLSIIFRTLLTGGTLVIPPINKAMEEMITEYQITHISLVATQFQRMLHTIGIKDFLSEMKAILLGGGPIPVYLLSKAADARLPVFHSYGSTEMASQITTTRSGELFEKLKTAGKLLPYREMQITADKEILVKGETLCQGYIQDGKLIRISDTEGWFHTGDIGELDKDGYLHVLGRKDNMFISGGENIQPEEIEQVIRQINGVEEVVVVPMDDVEYGQRPVAFIKIQEDQMQEDNIKVIKVSLKKVLPRFKIPDHFFPWPWRENMGETLKINRQNFRLLAEQILRKQQ